MKCFSDKDGMLSAANTLIFQCNQCSSSSLSCFAPADSFPLDTGFHKVDKGLLGE